MKFTIEKAVYGGAGLARSEGKAVFVPMTLPGEVVEAAIRRDQGSFAEADLVRVLAPSPERVAAPCPFYGSCGGCQYQHASYPAQLAIKQSVLAETLGRAGLHTLPEIAVHAGAPWGYRNRVRLHLDPVTHRLGYRRRASHAVLPVDRCPVAAPLLEAALRVLETVLAATAAGAWCSEVELFTNGDSSTLLLSFAERGGTGARPGDLQGVCEQIRAEVPQLGGAGLFRPKARTGRGGRARGRAQEPTPGDEGEGDAAGGSLLAAWGEPALGYEVAGQRYQVSLGAFFQGNRFLVDTLLGCVVSGSGSGKRRLAWDIFAGVGLFARALAGTCEQVVAVEGSPVSALDLRRNLGPGHKAVETSTLAFLSGAAARKSPPPELVVLDPPRAGLGLEAARLLASFRSRDITYVSCDPATLARDLRVLVDAGYTLFQLDLVDMFPQTFHLETVAKLRLR